MGTAITSFCFCEIAERYYIIMNLTVEKLIAKFGAIEEPGQKRKAEAEAADVKAEGDGADDEEDGELFFFSCAARARASRSGAASKATCALLSPVKMAISTA